jgi:hypothetical protein
VEVGLHRVGAGVLQLVGAQLVEQADAAALLQQVQQHAAAFRRDPAHRQVELMPAVAPSR